MWFMFLHKKIFLSRCWEGVIIIKKAYGFKCSERWYWNRDLSDIRFIDVLVTLETENGGSEMDACIG